MRKVFFILLFIVSFVFCKDRPAILFQKPVDFEFLKILKENGFEVDYLEKKEELNWERIKNYNVVVIFSTPDGEMVSFRGDKPSKERIKKFVSLIEKYLENGGGVFVISGERNIRKQLVSDLLKNWGAKIPLERIVEKDNRNISKMNHAPSTLIAYTDNIVDNKITRGVKGIWYPYSKTKNSQFTLPLYLDNSWKVLVKASKTSMTVPIDKNPDRWKDFYDEVFYREEGVSEPPILAVREYKRGRIGVTIQYPTFSIMSGTKWFCDNQILKKGVGERKSDFEKLLLNIFRYLSEPSLKTKNVGGYIDKEEKYLPPNYRSPVVKGYLGGGGWEYKKEKIENPSSPKVNIFKGIIGVKTSFSGYKGTVAEYAKLAEKLGLSFIVFMEDFDKIDEDIFEQLKEECKKFSNNKVKLFPGYTIKTNVGNYMIIFGPPEKISLPPDSCLTGPDRKYLYLQEENIKGEFTGDSHSPTFTWLLNTMHKCQIGYYNFNEVKNGMRITDLRLYSLAGIRYYRGNKLIEDITDEYLISAQGTIPPIPASINEVRSPEELKKEIEKGNALTYVVNKASLNSIYWTGLRYLSQYDAINTFSSDGPIILAWPFCFRPWVWGWGWFYPAEKIVMPALISVKSDKGLKEIKIFDGTRLFRRFILNGAKEFNHTLVLEGVIHRNLVLIAEDISGGKAISFALRAWKDGTHAIAFCSDHVNDCKAGPGRMKLGRGPFFPQINVPYVLPWEVSGNSWENGPVGYAPLSRSISHGHNPQYPFLDCDKGVENGGRFEGPMVLDFADEGISAVVKNYNKVYSDKVLNVVNSWNTFGDFKGEPKLFKYTLRYKEYLAPTLGPRYWGWPANSIVVGTKSTIYSCDVVFKNDVKINSLKIDKIIGSHKLLIYKKDGKTEVIDLTKDYEKKKIHLSEGDWFGFFGKKFSNPILYRILGCPVIYDLNNFEICADLEGKTFKKGERVSFSIYAISFPVNACFETKDSAIEIIKYLEKTHSLKVIKGKRVQGKVPAEFICENYAVGIRIPKPKTIRELVYPCIVNGLNPKWTACIFQKKGYILPQYGSGENKFRPLYVDRDGKAYFPLYISLANLTDVIVGHPIVADINGKDLIIKLTKVKEEPPEYHLSVNNPTDKVIKTKIKKNIDLPGLNFEEIELTVNPGEIKDIF